MIPVSDSSIGSARGTDLRDYMRVLRRGKGTIALTVLVVVATALVVSFLQTPIYQGTAELLLQPPTSSLVFSNSQASSSAQNIQTEIQVLKSAPVRAAVAKKLGSAPPVAAAAVGQTDVMVVKGQSTSAKRAAAIANGYADSYVSFKRSQAISNLDAAGNELIPRIADLQKQIDDLTGQINNAPVCIDNIKSPRDCQTRNNVQSTLTPRRDGLVTQQAVYKQRLDQLQVTAALSNGGAQVVTPATASATPIKPTPKRNGVLALGVGLILGVGLAFLFDYLDDSIKSKDDLERAAHGTPMLGIIPIVASWKVKEQAQVVSLTEPTSSAAEAYRALRTSIQFMGLDRPMRTVQITSPSAAEGKTTTLTNLAVALASAGQRVVMVDCDLRRPRLHQFFRLPNDVGFTSVLLGELPLREAVQQVGKGDIVMLASGPLPPNPSELLSSQRTVQVLAALQSEADVVLIDSPPVLPVTDAAVLSARVDATLLVTRAGTTTRKQLSRAVELLRQVDAPLVGTVFNSVSGDDAYGYAYNYRYYYRQHEEPERRRTTADKI